MSFNPEGVPRPESQEGEPKPATIRLEFFRHDQKTQESALGSREEDQEVRLSPEGRQHATEEGQQKNPHSETSIAYGSPRKRSSETSMRQMLANESGVTEEMSLEDIRALVGENIKVGRKDVVTKLLDFDVDSNEQFNAVATEHYGEKNDALNWLRTESDDLVRQLNDKDSSSYSRMAGNVAELVQKYAQIHPRWKKIVERDPQKYSQYDNELQRHLGSHLSVTESFLMKVIEKTEGSGAVDEFVSSLSNRSGFSYSEGYSVEISNDGNELQLTVHFKDKEWKITPVIIEEIIKERDELDREL